MEQQRQPRQEFLMKMYSELCNENNRNVQLGWQASGVFVGAFALFTFVDKKIISIDVAIALLILLANWAIVQLLNSNYWYNRNLVMIANIERQFLLVTDLHDIHYYFGKHRKVTSVLDDLRIQMALLISIVVLMIFYHFSICVLPGFINKGYVFYLQGTFPYIAVLFLLYYSIHQKNLFAKKYKEFLHNSPGIEINTEGIEYGVGHPTDE